MQDELSFRPFKAKARISLIVSLCVMIGGLALSDPFARWLLVFLGSGWLLVSFGRICTSVETMRLDEDGIEIATPFFVTRIRWRHTDSFSLERVQQNKVIVVKCRGWFRGRKPFRASTASYVEEDYFIHNLFETPLEDVLECLDEWLERYREREAGHPADDSEKQSGDTPPA